MLIEEAKKGLKYDVYCLKNFLTDTEKEIWQQAIDTVLNELEKKDKVIDEMAELISRKVGSRTEICPNMKCDKSIEECKECAIEYFYKKVSDNK